MSFTKEKREQIKSYILDKIIDNQENLVTYTAQKCEVSVTTVQRYLGQLQNDGIIKTSDNKCGYEIINIIDDVFVLSDTISDLDEQMKTINNEIAQMTNNLTQYYKDSRFYI